MTSKNNIKHGRKKIKLKKKHTDKINTRLFDLVLLPIKYELWRHQNKFHQLIIKPV